MVLCNCDTIIADSLANAVENGRRTAAADGFVVKGVAAEATVMTSL